MMSIQNLNEPYVTDTELIQKAIAVMAAMPITELFSSQLEGLDMNPDPFSPICLEDYPNARVGFQEELCEALGKRPDTFAELCAELEATRYDLAMSGGYPDELNRLRICLLALTELTYDFMTNSFRKDVS